MNERTSVQLKCLLSDPEHLKGTKEEMDEVLKILQDASNGKELTMSQLLKVSMASDMNLKHMFSMVYLPDDCFRETALLELIRKEEMEKIYFIVSNYIFIKDGEYYLVSGCNAREKGHLNEQTVQMLIELLIRKGYPLNARQISSSKVHYQPSCLDVPGISRTNLFRYMFGWWGVEVPSIDKVTIDVINGLNHEDMDKVLEMVLQAYRHYEVDSVYDDFVIIKREENKMFISVLWTDFSGLRTESSVTDELINLQKRLFTKQDQA